MGTGTMHPLNYRGAGAALGARLVPFAIIFVAIQFGVRFTLSLRVKGEAADGVWGFLAPFLIGVWFDLALFCVSAVPVVLRWLVAPRGLKEAASTAPSRRRRSWW
jgi:hypothetical protein